MNDIDDLRRLVLPGDDWSCCGHRGSDVNGTEDAFLVEAAILLGRYMRDKDGKITLFRAPPAYIVALIKMLRAPDPVSAINTALSAEAHARLP